MRYPVSNVIMLIAATLHGCALGRKSGGEVAESSMSRSGQVEARSERGFVSTGEPGTRRSQAKTIRPLTASMVRMRSGSIPIKGSTTQNAPPTGSFLRYPVSNVIILIAATLHGCALGRKSGGEVAESSMSRSGQVEARSERGFVSTGEPGTRRSQAKTIRPLTASMVRMRSGSIPK